MNLLANILSTAASGITQFTAVILLAVTLFLAGYVKGGDSVRTEWAADQARRMARAAEVKADKAETTTRVVTQYVDRVRIVRQKGETITKEVPVYVPPDTCPLPGGFRLLHDAAARGEPPGPAGNPDAAPVPAQDAAATVADNYAACQETTEQLIALQFWVSEQTKADQ